MTKEQALKSLFKEAQASPLFSGAFSSFVSKAMSPVSTSIAKSVPLAGDAISRTTKGITKLVEQAKPLPTPKLTPPNPMMPGTKNLGKPPKPILDHNVPKPTSMIKNKLGKPPSSPAPAPGKLSQPVTVQKTSSIESVREWARSFVPPQR